MHRLPHKVQHYLSLVWQLCCTQYDLFSTHWAVSPHNKHNMLGSATYWVCAYSSLRCPGKPRHCHTPHSACHSNQFPNCGPFSIFQEQSWNSHRHSKLVKVTYCTIAEGPCPSHNCYSAGIQCCLLVLLPLPGLLRPTAAFCCTIRP